MKEFLILLALSIGAFIQAQNWAPLGAKWHYSANEGGMDVQGSEYYLYEVTNDTIVAGKNCKKIEITYYKYRNGDTVYLPPLLTYDKNDSVYYFNDKDQRFFLLYDFTGKKGDTLTFPVAPSSIWGSRDTIFRVIVDTITNYIVSSDTLKWFHTTPLDNFSFHGGYVEIIGSTFLMLPQPEPVYMEWDGPLRCYQDSSHYVNFSQRPCDERDISGVYDTHNHNFRLYPNPTQECTTLEFYNPKNEEYTLSIFNYQGQVVDIIPEINSGKIEFDCMELISGVYFIQLRRNQKLFLTAKLIKE